jgi:DNA-directed RNA polymerase specialized sigma24 family protein
MSLPKDIFSRGRILGCGYSYLEIAEHRGWTYSKLDRCVRRGRAALRASEAVG